MNAVTESENQVSENQVVENEASSEVAEFGQPWVPQVVHPSAPAIEYARSVLLELEAAATVGNFMDAIAEGEFSTTYNFAAELPGYAGWYWTVVLAGEPGAVEATISEVALLPGASSLTAPAWVPWAERIRPGDLNPGDTLATPADDPRLVPGYLDSGNRRVRNGIERETRELATEIGLGRKRLFSRDGREDAADRWKLGEYGPQSPMALSSRFNCGRCGYYLHLEDSLGALFGVCANQYAADGRVVSIDYGCGAHSDIPEVKPEAAVVYDAYDDGAIEIIARSDS